MTTGARAEMAAERGAWQEFVCGARAELGLSFREFAAALGHKHHSRVQSWCEGRAIPWCGRRAGVEAQIQALLEGWPKKSA